MNFCPQCGHPVRLRVPEGDHVSRHVCDHCGAIHYRNPKVIVGCLGEWHDGRVLMCRRAIEPRLGYWTFPAGFMEMAETTAQGAAREAFEEGGVEVEIDGLLAVINVPHVSQVYVIHRGRLISADHHPTAETSETRLLHEAEIPWDRIAFPTIYHSLKFFFADRAVGRSDVHHLDLPAGLKFKDQRL
ncbi:MAG: NUDIX hydrolase [Gammaproteobacteria bacterium]|nr:NUDIX hydrolase [Gammaproteobacteria bacterium]